MKARALFSKFLDAAVADYTWSAWRFRRDFETLTQEQFEACLDQIIAEQTAKKTSRAVLAQRFDISAWRIEGRATPTSSTITMHYGADPSITTQLHFERMEEFQFIKSTLANLGLCKLNEKHLKGR